jgi:hypothetical protein
MPKRCGQCSFFSLENRLDDCPECGTKLQFTMFVPPSHATEVDAPPSPKAWDVKSAAFEQLELPLAVRWGQLLGGVSMYGLISYTVRNYFLTLAFAGETRLNAQQSLIALLLIMLVFHVVGALVGGAVAGAWSVHWLPQGIGVGIGVFLLPFILYCLLGSSGKEPLIAFLFVIFLTTGVSILGAFIGHKMIRPSRYIVS